MNRAQPVPLEQYFAGRDERSRALFAVVRAAIESIGPVHMRVTKSQVAFRNNIDEEVIRWLRESWEETK